MPTNANTFNSRVTSEALEAKFRQVFPAQGGAELVQDLFASGVIQPVVDFSSVAEGSVLPQNLQTAWDFSTGSKAFLATTPSPTLISNTGFWLIWGNLAFDAGQQAEILIFDGVSSKTVQKFESSATLPDSLIELTPFVVFLRSGDEVRASNNSGSARLFLAYRQIADVNGNLVNPLGFTF